MEDIVLHCSAGPVVVGWGDRGLEGVWGGQVTDHLSVCGGGQAVDLELMVS